MVKLSYLVFELVIDRRLLDLFRFWLENVQKRHVDFETHGKTCEHSDGANVPKLSGSVGSEAHFVPENIRRLVHCLILRTMAAAHQPIQLVGYANFKRHNPKSDRFVVRRLF
jgi:hypothetical protein